MAVPMTADQQLTAFRNAGIVVKEVNGWRTRNRNHKGPWGPVHGLMVHHTGSDSLDQVALLRDGRSDLPGPLSQYGISQDGVLWLIGNGRANHAGSGDADVLAAVKAENYGNYPPTDNQTNADGNVHFYGVEIWYSGSHGMSKAQYATLLKLAAALFKFHKWGAKSAIGHGEWQPGKWDPGYASGKMMDMNAVRNDIAAVMLGKGEPAPKPEIPAEPKPRVFEVKSGDVIAFPGGAKVEVQ